MRTPALHTNDQAVAPAGDELVASTLIVLGEFAQGIWIEVLVALCAMYIYYWHVRSQKSAKPLPKTPEPRGGQRQINTNSRPVKNYKSQVLDSGSGAGDESRAVQRLVISLLQKAPKSNTSALLAQYQEISKACGANLRQHISDDHNAQAMYLALIGCAVAEPVTASSGAAAWRRTSSLLADMQTFGFPRSVDFYAGALKTFMNAQLSQECFRLHDAMTHDGMLPSSAMLISLMGVAVSFGYSDKAISLFESIAETSPPSPRTVMTILRVHSSNKDWHSAVTLLDRLESLGTPPDNLILNTVLGLCISSGQFDVSMEMLQRRKGIADVISCNILLKGCSQQGSLTQAEALLGEMLTKGPAPNLISYNTVMDCAVRSMQTLGGSSGRGHNAEPRSKTFIATARRPWELLDQLLTQGLDPDRYTCSTLVKGMHIAGCSISDIDRAVDLLNRIGAAALQAPPTNPGSGSSISCNARLLEVLFNTLLDACITVRDLDRMTQIFAMMQEFKVSVSAVTYGTLIKAFGQASRLNRCHEVWDDMQRAGIHPTIVTYGCYIDACIRNENTDHAEEIFEAMFKTSHGVRPNAVIYTSMIRGLAHVKKPRKALELYRRMQQDGIQATSVTFNSVLDLVARQLSEPSVLQEVIDDMCSASVAPDVVTYSILMQASCNAGNIQNALSLFRQIHSKGLAFDQVAFNTLLLACSKAELVSDAEDIFEEMRRVEMMPSHVTTSIMVKMYGKAKMLEKAIALSERLERECGQSPNIYVYTCLIQACVQNKQVRRSWEIFNKMVGAGVQPDAITYGTLIHGCVYLNKFSFAMSLVRHAYQRPQGADPDTPFSCVGAVQLKQAVPLQPDVLQMLGSAMQRKEQHSLVSELEEIMATSAANSVSFNEGSKYNGGRQNRRGQNNC